MNSNDSFVALLALVVVTALLLACLVAISIVAAQLRGIRVSLAKIAGGSVVGDLPLAVGTLANRLTDYIERQFHAVG